MRREAMAMLSYVLDSVVPIFSYFEKKLDELGFGPCQVVIRGYML